MIMKALELITILLDKVIGVLPVPDTFISALDGAITFLVTTINAAGWIIPLDILVVCLGVVFAVENFHILTGIVKYIIKLIPFVG